MVLRLSGQIAKALAFLHARGIVHRDIKPANVLLDDDDLNRADVRLADLGLAKVAPEQQSVVGMYVSTAGKARFGTWEYMAPEQWADAKKVDPQTDVYSLGILMFQMISGTMPFVAGDAKSLMRMHLLEEPPMEQLRGKCGRQLFQFVGRMLRKTPRERPQMDDVVARLGTLEQANG